MKIWLLVFLMSNGQPAISGPHRWEVCEAMAKDQVQARCWNMQTMRRSGPEGSSKDG